MEASDELIRIEDYVPIQPIGIDEGFSYVKAYGLPFELRVLRNMRHLKEYIDQGRAPVLYWKDTFPNWVCLYGYTETPIDKCFLSTGNPIQPLTPFPERENTFILSVPNMMKYVLSPELSCSVLVPTI